MADTSHTYSCSRCSLAFPDAITARRHFASAEHKQAAPTVIATAPEVDLATSTRLCYWGRDLQVVLPANTSASPARLPSSLWLCSAGTAAAVSTGPQLVQGMVVSHAQTWQDAMPPLWVVLLYRAGSFSAVAYQATPPSLRAMAKSLRAAGVAPVAEPELTDSSSQAGSDADASDSSDEVIDDAPEVPELVAAASAGAEHPHAPFRVPLRQVELQAACDAHGYGSTGGVELARGDVLSLMACATLPEQPAPEVLQRAVRQCDYRIIAHKSASGYTVRKKQGGAQSGRDTSGSRPRSIGAQLRRANERQLVTRVHECIASWRSIFAVADAVFVGCAHKHMGLLQANPAAMPPGAAGDVSAAYATTPCVPLDGPLADYQHRLASPAAAALLTDSTPLASLAERQALLKVSHPFQKASYSCSQQVYRKLRECWQASAVPEEPWVWDSSEHAAEASPSPVEPPEQHSPVPDISSHAGVTANDTEASTAAISGKSRRRKRRPKKKSAPLAGAQPAKTAASPSDASNGSDDEVLAAAMAQAAAQREARQEALAAQQAGTQLVQACSTLAAGPLTALRDALAHMWTSRVQDADVRAAIAQSVQPAFAACAVCIAGRLWEAEGAPTNGAQQVATVLTRSTADAEWRPSDQVVHQFAESSAVDIAQAHEMLHRAEDTSQSAIQLLSMGCNFSDLCVAIGWDAAAAVELDCMDVAMLAAHLRLLLPPYLASVV